MRSLRAAGTAYGPSTFGSNREAKSTWESIWNVHSLQQRTKRQPIRDSSIISDISPLTSNNVIVRSPNAFGLRRRLGIPPAPKEVTSAVVAFKSGSPGVQGDSPRRQDYLEPSSPPQ